MMSKFPCLLVPLQVDDDHELYEGDEGDGEASQDPDVDGLEVGGAGGVVKDVVAHGHDAQHRRDPERHPTRNLINHGGRNIMNEMKCSLKIFPLQKLSFSE